MGIFVRLLANHITFGRNDWVKCLAGKFEWDYKE